MLRNGGSGADVSLREEQRLSPKSLLDEGPSGSRPEEQTDEATFSKQMAETLYAML